MGMRQTAIGFVGTIALTAASVTAVAADDDSLNKLATDTLALKDDVQAELNAKGRALDVFPLSAACGPLRLQQLFSGPTNTCLKKLEGIAPTLNNENISARLDTLRGRYNVLTGTAPETDNPIKQPSPPDSTQKLSCEQQLMADVEDFASRVAPSVNFNDFMNNKNLGNTAISGQFLATCGAIGQGQAVIAGPQFYVANCLGTIQEHDLAETQAERIELGQLMSRLRSVQAGQCVGKPAPLEDAPGIKI